MTGADRTSGEAAGAQSHRPAFLITIDAEGDNLWSRPSKIKTANARFLPRFQDTCEEYGFKPTYLTNHEMAQCEAFRRFAADALSRGTAEVGMHLHPWNTPPEFSLTEGDNACHPYVYEYPPHIVRAKASAMTDILEEAFNVKMVSHRAGRWGFDGTYAGILVDLGYQVDCSVTPGVSWRHQPGTAGGIGGADYRHFPTGAYWLDLDDISRPGTSSLLEVPVTIIRRKWPVIDAVRPAFPKGSFIRKALDGFMPPVRWLRPKRGNLSKMLRIIDKAAAAGYDYVEFMLHSSELMPGGSPTFRTEKSIEQLYDDLHRLFKAAAGHFAGCTLAEYCRRRKGALCNG